MTSGSIPLLETKLRPPRPRASLLERPRLVDLAEQILEVPLTVVAAPAGFGKSTLMVAWYEALAERAAVAWLSLDETHSDPDLFARYLRESVSRAFGEQFDERLSVEALAAEIVNRATELARAAVVMLDDYQLVESARVDTALRFLLDHLPSDMHLVIGSRRDPQWPLARLRARGRLLEVRADDLRFTGDEAGGLLNETERLGLSEDQVETLESRTEGWAAALQLAALSVKGKGDAGRFIEAFSGSHRFVYDYLAEEVFQAQADETRAFLLRTSVLDRLSGPLCDAVSGLDRSGARLEALNRANLFTIALDDEGRWFRYHHLFRDFLRRQLEDQHPDEVRTMNRRASEWFAGEELLEEAVPHAIAAGDSEWTLSLIERAIPAATLRGDILTPGFDRWMQALDWHEIERRPRLALPVALSRALGGRLSGTDQLIDGAVEVIEGRAPSTSQMSEAELENQRGIASLARAYVERYRGNPEKALAIVDAALESQKDEMTRAWLGMKRQLILFEAWAPGHEPSMEAIELAARGCYAVGHVSGATAMNVVGYYRLAWSGQQDAADRYIRAALTEAYERNGLPAVGMVHGAVAESHYERGELDDAEDDARRCLALGAPGSAPGLFIPPEATLARVQIADGRIDGARESIRQLEERVRPVETVQGRVFFPALLAHLRLLAGDIAAAERWAQSSGLSPATDPMFANEYACLVYARVLAASGQPREPLALLERIGAQAAAAGRHGRALEARLIAASCLWRAGDERQAPATFSDVLAAAERAGYARTVLDEGEPVLAMLRRAAAGGRQAAYATRLLMLAGEAGAPAARIAGGPDHLSTRELDVLRLLVLGSSNREIADDLVVSLDTVKTHLRNVYGKLGAHSRTQAIAAARARGLV